jgi:exonuclease SbcC
VRPRRLIMEGFLAYRHRTEVDFTDADLFVLSGPTGSGKSSVIDGMTFALYGTIPRLDDRRSVSPVISAMSDQARVSFEFSVGDEVFTAVRLVHRARAGEARLQRGEDVLASGPAEVTAGVTRLLGLSYDHFTKAVVLPQGAFADFLTDRPAERQALLRALLEIGLFEQVMQLANTRAGVARARSESIQERLDKLDVPSPDQLEEARKRLDQIRTAGGELPARMEKLRHLETRVQEARASYSVTSEIIARLGAITVPSHLESLDQERSAAGERLSKAGESLTAIVARGVELDEAISAHPGLQQLESWQGDRRRLQELVTTRATLSLDALVVGVEQAAAARDAARASLEALRVEHAAHDLRHALVAGEPCPVCRGVVTTIPAEKDDPGDSIDRLAVEIGELEVEASEARDRLKEAEGQSKQIDQRITELEAALATAPTDDLAASTMTMVKELIAGRTESLQMEKATRAELEAAQVTVDELTRRAAGLRDALFAARDAAAGEEPPIPGDDVVEAWREFASWRLQRVESRKNEQLALAGALEEAEEKLTGASTEFRSWLQDLGIEDTGSPEIDLALAIERRTADVQELEKTVAEAEDLGRELGAETTRARVASSLGTHLRSNNFEAWLLEEALDTLIDGANRLLDELSAGAYSLKAKDSQFEVIDHRNAGLIRTTRGLSGGETFLVALSLALSMAEQLAELTGMTSRLESVLLDEGFGSLDQESLDVVATVLDDLVGQGRTVGIVTHVRELADRMPVRFEVTKGPETASVEKVMT